MNTITQNQNDILAATLTDTLKQMVGVAALSMMEQTGLTFEGAKQLRQDMESTTLKIDEIEGTLSECVSEDDCERQITDALENFDIGDALRNSDILENVEDHESRIDTLEGSAAGTEEWQTEADARFAAIEMRQTSVDASDNETLKARVDLLERQLANVLELMAAIRAVGILANKF